MLRYDVELAVKFTSRETNLLMIFITYHPQNRGVYMCTKNWLIDAIAMIVYLKHIGFGSLRIWGMG